MGFCLLLKIWVKNQKRLYHAKQSAADAFKTASKKAIQKTEKVTGDLIGNKISDKITKVSKNHKKIKFRNNYK